MAYICHACPQPGKPVLQGGSSTGQKQVDPCLLTTTVCSAHVWVGVAGATAWHRWRGTVWRTRRGVMLGCCWCCLALVKLNRSVIYLRLRSRMIGRCWKETILLDKGGRTWGVTHLQHCAAVWCPCKKFLQCRGQAEAKTSRAAPIYAVRVGLLWVLHRGELSLGDLISSWC